MKAILEFKNIHWALDKARKLRKVNPDRIITISRGIPHHIKVNGKALCSDGTLIDIVGK